MMLVAITGDAARYSADYVTNYANVYVLDALKRVPGAGQAQIMGVPDPGDADLDEPGPHGLARYHDDRHRERREPAERPLRRRPDRAAAECGAGRAEAVTAQGPFIDPRQYEHIILRASQAARAIVRVGDVARAESGCAGTSSTAGSTTRPRPSSRSTSDRARTASSSRTRCARRSPR